MNNITPRIGSAANNQGIEHRHATALHEIRQMHEDFQRMQIELTEARRTIDQQANLIDLLTKEKDHRYQEARVFQRKLIRLAAAMDMMGKLSKDAEEIMRSTREWEENGDHETEQESVAEIVAKLPKGVDQ